MRSALRFAVALSCALVAGAAGAQCTATGIPSSCTQARTLRITARATVEITVTPTSFNFAPTASDYTQGYTQALGHSVTLKVNDTWTLSIRSSQTNWTASGGARTTKPRTDLEWATSSGGPYTAMPGNNAGSALTVVSGGATSSTTVNLWYRVLWDWTLDSPGTYTLPVILLLSAP